MILHFVKLSTGISDVFRQKCRIGEKSFKNGVDKIKMQVYNAGRKGKGVFRAAGSAPAMKDAFVFL